MNAAPGVAHYKLNDCRTCMGSGLVAISLFHVVHRRAVRPMPWPAARAALADPSAADDGRALLTQIGCPSCMTAGTGSPSVLAELERELLAGEILP